MNNANGGNVIYKFIGDTTNLDKAASKTNGILKGIGAATGVMAAGVITATTAATAAIISVTKKSVEAYAEMEQLAGGAQKIFDEMDYTKIENDAKQAYKTMNLSASQYLALINDVGATFASTMGDEKGYNAAKEGLQAISDYASGTGKNVDLLGQKFTMITRSTSSYQSIADQFSGVLPATSEAFLQQAQAAGILSQEYTKLTDVPIAEYQQAVSEMLTKGVADLGLANNTLNESTQTITGSIAAAKGAIQNFLSGTGSIDEVINTVITAGTQIGKAVVKLLPNVVDGIVGIINGLIPELPNLIQKLLPVLINGVIELINGLAASLPTLIPVLLDGIVTAIQQITNILPDVLKALIEATVLVINALAEQLPDLIPVIIDAILEVIPLLIDNLPLFITAGMKITLALAEGLIKSVPTILSHIPQIISSILGYFKRMPKEMWNIGKDVITGLWNGIKNFDLIGNMKQLAKKALNAFKSMLGIHSPSTEFAYLGKMSMLGYTNQLEDMKGMLDNVIESTFSISPQLTTGNLHYSPNVIVNTTINQTQDPLGRMVNDVKTFSGGARNDYNYGMGV